MTHCPCRGHCRRRSRQNRPVSRTTRNCACLSLPEVFEDGPSKSQLLSLIGSPDRHKISIWILVLRHEDARAEPYDTLGKPALRRLLPGKPVPFRLPRAFIFRMWKSHGIFMGAGSMTCP